MNLVVDFDRTLYDTDNIYKKLIKLATLSLKVSKEKFLEAWKEYQEVHEVFNLFDLIRIWPQVSEEKKQDVITTIKKFMSVEGEKFVYPDVKSFFQSYPHLKVLTYGNPEFQQHKMKSSRLNSMGSHFAICEEKKWFMKDYFTEDLVFLIDDHPETIAMVKKLYPHVVCIQMKRRGAKYSAMHSPYADYEISTLYKISRIIEKYT